MRWVAIAVLSLLMLSAVCASLIAPHGYAEQTREYPNIAPSREFPLGTDDLGRDRFSRLVYGTRVSLLLAPTAAVLSTFIAVLVGGLGACAGVWWDRGMSSATDLMLSIPTILILLTARAMMPLNISPWSSILITCLLLGLLGWPAAARVIRADVSSLLGSAFLLQARACGQSRLRILVRQLLPNLRPVLIAQFWILVPVFILSEANLSLLGLGVSEPLPSWGNLLRELENYAAIPERPWVLAPLLALMLTILCVYAAVPQGDES